MENKTAVILGFVRPKNEDILIGAIESLKKQSFKNFEIFVYDNSELPDSLAKLKKQFSEVHIKKNEKNNGFAGGNNSIMREILNDETYKYIALLNDDTKADSNWLENLVSRANSDNKIGAVTSKLVFFEPYVRIEFETSTFNPVKLNIGEDTRDLGVKLFADSGFTNSNYAKKFYRNGCYGFEGDYTWTKDKFIVDYPIGEEELKKDYELRLHVEKSKIKDQKLKIKVNDKVISEIDLEDNKSEYVVKIPAKNILENKMDLIQNAGSGITAQFNGYDIGNTQKETDVSSSAEVDEGQYDEGREVEMFCGGAVLLNANTLREVGIFDEYMFVYYEDSDLSLRFRKKSWKIIYEPKALVRHMHATSSTEYSQFFTYHIRKNKLAFVLKNYNLRPNIFALSEITKETLKLCMSALKHKFKNSHGNMMLKTNLKSILTFIINVPSLLLKRFNIIKCD